MSDAFTSRSDVAAALQELVESRLDMTEQGRGDDELLAADDFLAQRGIELPHDTEVRLVRMSHESEEQALAPLCPNGERAQPVDCRLIRGRWVCDWICQ
jgi:hypothetical protein